MGGWQLLFSLEFTPGTSILANWLSTPTFPQKPLVISTPAFLGMYRLSFRTFLKRSWQRRPSKKICPFFFSESFFTACGKIKSGTSSFSRKKEDHNNNNSVCLFYAFLFHSNLPGGGATQTTKLSPEQQRSVCVCIPILIRRKKRRGGVPKLEREAEWSLFPIHSRAVFQNSNSFVFSKQRGHASGERVCVHNFGERKRGLLKYSDVQCRQSLHHLSEWKGKHDFLNCPLRFSRINYEAISAYSHFSIAFCVAWKLRSAVKVFSQTPTGEK